MPELKPCPFCGSEKISFGHSIADGEIIHVYCHTCKALVKFPIEVKSKHETFGETMSKWAEKWNRRETK